MFHLQLCAAVEQQTAGNVGGFNKKWVSLCVQNQLRFLFYADCTAQNSTLRNTILPAELVKKTPTIDGHIESNIFSRNFYLA